ncbi:M20/M25/M40 family metallo-hydrolase [Oligoflexia bacterium]|nr:M20/M25/M40 family metallo-hydrolase [Oligoflexia bacterium]
MEKVLLERIYTEQEQSYISGLQELLRIKSVSADPDYEKDCLCCAEWLNAHLNKIGLQSTLLKTRTKPVVFATYPGKPNHPVVSFYGHYDVQPVDPLELWESDPFEPELRDGRLYARGAQDNKGQLFFFLKALEALIAAQALNCTVKVFIEGEEERGSGGIIEAAEGWKEQLKSDILLVCDSGTRAAGVATITLGLRGMAGCSVRLIGPNKDLHSGMHGGVAPNPATVLAQLIASLHNADGSVAVEGFYDAVVKLDEGDRALANKYFMDPAMYEKLVGIAPSGGEAGYTMAERHCFRPTVEVNGMQSGYNGPGMKTIIPSVATAKLSTRLVDQQEPEDALNKIIAHLKARVPEGLKLEESERELAGPALRLSSNSALVQKAKGVLEEVSGGEVEVTWMGGSIPVVSTLVRVSGAEPLLVGFGVEEDNIHAPNESFLLSQFKQGFLYTGLFLSRL